MKKLRPVTWISALLVLVAVIVSLFFVLNEVSAKGLEQTKGDPVAGKAVFSKTCTGCHLNNGLDAGRAPVLAGKARTVEFVTNQIRNGGTRMPKFGTDRVSEADLPNVVAYVVSLGPAPAPAAPAAGLGHSAEEGFNLLWLVLPLMAVGTLSGLALVGYKRTQRSRR